MKLEKIFKNYLNKVIIPKYKFIDKVEDVTTSFDNDSDGMMLQATLVLNRNWANLNMLKDEDKIYFENSELKFPFSSLNKKVYTGWNEEQIDFVAEITNLYRMLDLNPAKYAPLVLHYKINSE